MSPFSDQRASIKFLNAAGVFRQPRGISKLCRNERHSLPQSFGDFRAGKDAVRCGGKLAKVSARVIGYPRLQKYRAGFLSCERIDANNNNFWITVNKKFVFRALLPIVIKIFWFVNSWIILLKLFTTTLIKIYL